MSLKIATLALAFLGFAQVASADIQPLYSSISLQSAKNGCESRGGQVLEPYNMTTVTAQNNQFYIVVCERPDPNGGSAYVPTWSAIGYEDAEQRCTTNSASTNLAGGAAVGKEIYAQPNSTLIYIIACDVPN